MLIDKFTFREFNCLIYHREISNILVVSNLLGLFNYETLSDNLKSINLAIFCKLFLEFIQYIHKTTLFVNNFI